MSSVGSRFSFVVLEPKMSSVGTKFSFVVLEPKMSSVASKFSFVVLELKMSRVSSRFSFVVLELKMASESSVGSRFPFVVLELKMSSVGSWLYLWCKADAQSVRVSPRPELQTLPSWSMAASSSSRKRTRCQSHPSFPKSTDRPEGPAKMVATWTCHLPWLPWPDRCLAPRRTAIGMS